MTHSQNTAHEARRTVDAVAEYVDANATRWRVEAEFKRLGGRLNITSVRISPAADPAHLTRRVLRDLPLHDLFGEALAHESVSLPVRSSTGHQGRAHSDEDLLAVADVYTAAFGAHRPVQRAVAQAFGISVSTAAKRIMVARRRGFIPSAESEEP